MCGWLRLVARVAHYNNRCNVPPVVSSLHVHAICSQCLRTMHPWYPLCPSPVYMFSSYGPCPSQISHGLMMPSMACAGWCIAGAGPQQDCRAKPNNFTVGWIQDFCRFGLSHAAALHVSQGDGTQSQPWYCWCLRPHVGLTRCWQASVLHVCSQLCVLY